MSDNGKAELAATTVRVTRQHIDNGMPGDACACAFAAAVYDALREQGIKPGWVNVGSTHDEGSRTGWQAEVNVGSYLRPRIAVAELPGTVVDWIFAYDGCLAGDEEKDVAPFDVELKWVLAS